MSKERRSNAESTEPHQSGARNDVHSPLRQRGTGTDFGVAESASENKIPSGPSFSKRGTEPPAADSKGGSEQSAAGSFLGRWSRLKLEADESQQLPEVAGDPPPQGSQPAAVLTDADLPSPESLDEDADYAAFLAPGISSGLRRRALQHLFALSQFNRGDGLDEYAEDFTRFPPLGDLVTREMRRVLELEKDGSGQEEMPDSEVSTDKDEAVESINLDEKEPGNKMEKE